MSMEFDVLAFGAHPDDIEIGLAGTLARHAAEGHAVGLCDLTRGELSSNGTLEERRDEAEAARVVLGARWRGNLEWPDGEIEATPERLRQVVELIRRVRPRVVAIPYWDDQHPDHAAASRVLGRATFLSGLRRYAAPGDAWRPGWICHYFINDAAQPSFLVDVSDYYEIKRQALARHRSQFEPADGGAVATRLNSPLFLQLIEARDAQFGALAGVRFAEGVVVRQPILRANLFRS